MSEPPRIWLTRPQDDSVALAAALANHGIDSIIAPVMRIERCVFSDFKSDKPDAILLTSRHAAHALSGLPADWRTLPLFAVGTATAEAARAASFTTVIEGDGGVLELLPRIAGQLAPGARILYLAGEETSADMPALLGARGIAVEQVTAYRAIAETSLPPEMLTALKKNAVTGTVFFSARSAQLAAELLAHHQMAAAAARMDAYCLSLAVAGAAGKLPWRAIHACHTPSRAAMVELIVSQHAKEVL
jgi:uroporphyrinogen-III synthase